MPVTASFEARKAIESLRAGVPNLSAVAALRLDNADILTAFDREINRVRSLKLDASWPRRGFFVEGNFGSGKSHALRYLQTIAGAQGMAFSLVAVSKEAPLHDLNGIYRSAISSLNLGSGILGGSLASVFEKMDMFGKPFADLCDGLRKASSSSAPLFLASLLLLRRYRSAPEIVEQLCDFWDGGPPQIAPWRKLLRDVDEMSVNLKAVPVAELSIDRFRFAATALVAGGYSGWFIALDELELISKFGLRSRAKAYASLSLLFEDAIENDKQQRWFVVGAITGDLTSELIDRRDDLNVLKSALRWEQESLSMATRGIEILVERARTFRLKEPNILDLTRAHHEIQRLYESAYGTMANNSFVPSGGRLSKSMRQYVREWIAYWDLKMQDPTYEPSISSQAVTYSLAEDSDLESAS